MASDAAPVAESSKPSPSNNASDSRQPQAETSKLAASNSQTAPPPADNKTGPSRDNNSTKDAKSQGKKSATKTRAAVPANQKTAVHDDAASRE